MRGRIATFAVVVAVGVVGCGDSDESTTSTQAGAAPVTCPDPATNPADSFDANELIGLTVEDATGVAQSHGCSVRVAERDGEPLPATMDLRGDRIDVTVVDGKITAVSLS
jgi:hypothetical protein